MGATGVEEFFGSQKSSNETQLSKNSITVLHPVLSEEVKAVFLIYPHDEKLRQSLRKHSNICFSKKSLEVNKSWRFSNNVPMFSSMFSHMLRLHLMLYFRSLS